MSEITEAEEIFCTYKFGMKGGFYSSLIETMFKADIINQSKLHKGFPDLMDVVYKYGNEDMYWENLVARWNQQYPKHKISI
jgi:hypothetical protein